MRFQCLLLAAVALTAASCSSPSTSSPQEATQADPPPTFPSAEAELAYLRAENARLRGRVSGVARENIVLREREAVVEARQKAVSSGKLEQGMSVQEAAQVINGSPELTRDTCQLVSQTGGQWTYRILSDAPVTGVGAGSIGSVGTNMRSGLTPTVQTWICVFDAKTGKLSTFRRESNRQP
ncbi:MAG TPA: hypothetical protein VF595_10385 [Tepidisphaeraceae bacterium]|jgi:hypothetical protein